MPELNKCEFTCYIFLLSFSHLLLFSAVVFYKNELPFFCHTLSILLVYILNFLPNIHNFLSLLLLVTSVYFYLFSEIHAFLFHPIHLH